MWIFYQARKFSWNEDHSFLDLNFSLFHMIDFNFIFNTAHFCKNSISLHWFELLSRDQLYLICIHENRYQIFRVMSRFWWSVIQSKGDKRGCLLNIWNLFVRTYSRLQYSQNLPYTAQQWRHLLDFNFVMFHNK